VRNRGPLTQTRDPIQICLDWTGYYNSELASLNDVLFQLRAHYLRDTLTVLRARETLTIPFRRSEMASN
jgi:hypothetical protein